MYEENFIVPFGLLSYALCAQEDNSKYLAGAVPVVNGKVIFAEVIQASDMSKRQIYDALLKWAEKRFTPSKGRRGESPILMRKKGRLHVWVKSICNFRQRIASSWIVLLLNTGW